VQKQYHTRYSNLLFKIMIKLAPVVAFVLAVCSFPGHAWWDNNWTDDFFGDGFGAGDFGFGFSMHGRGHGHGYGYDAPYWGYSPHYRPPYYALPAPAPAPVLTDEQRAALAEQQKAIADQQQQAFQRAVAAQREFAERLNREMMSPPELPPDISKRIQEHEAKREAIIRERESSRYGSRPKPAPRPEGMNRGGGEAQLQRTELLNQKRDQHQHNPVMTEPDMEM
jgi:hypothetical protein